MISEVSMTRLIPHRELLVMLDRVISVSEESIECEVVITNESFLCADGKVPAYVGMEYIAQSISAFGGASNLDSEKAPEIGFLLGVRRYKSKRPYFEVGDVLRVKAESVIFDGSLGSFTGSISIDGEKVVETSISTFKPTKEQLKELREDLDV